MAFLGASDTPILGRKRVRNDFYVYTCPYEPKNNILTFGNDGCIKTDLAPRLNYIHHNLTSTIDAFRPYWDSSVWCRNFDRKVESWHLLNCVKLYQVYNITDNNFIEVKKWGYIPLICWDKTTAKLSRKIFLGLK